MRRFFVAYLIVLAAVACGEDVRIRLSALGASPTFLALNQTRIPLTGSGGGFEIEDFAGRKPITLARGVVREEAGAQIFTAAGGDVALRATFTCEDGSVRVRGEVVNNKPGDRAVVLRYRLPVRTEGAVFEDELSRSTPVGPETHGLGTVFPLAAITGDKWGVAIAIPPFFPCCFGMTGSARGLGVEFYMGLSVDTRRFRNAAEFHFLIYAAKPSWGFRSALQRYYDLHPAYYAPRFKGGGFWNWQEKGDIEDALSLYRLQGITHTRTFYDEIKRNKRLGLLTFDYVIVGQRELKHLRTLPKGYEGAMQVFRQFVKQWRAHPEGKLRTQYRHWRDRDLPDLIERCACKDADGRYRIRVRRSAWAENSITFTMNPNPALFADKGWDSVGSTTLQTARQWFEHEPIDGIMIDSLGAQWPAALNYRRDHFAYAHYPLTFDKEGRVALHNRISHYEFLEALRRLARAKWKFLFGNGIYRYRRRKMPEHFNGIENGRFFVASLLDAAGREQTRLFTRQELECFRTYMGRKLFAPILYKWRNPDMVRRQLNRALPFAVFAGPNRCFVDGVSYLTSKDGYQRDKKLLHWFVRNCRMLFDAGWEPVTHARASDPNVACERYGSGDVVYFGLVNFGNKPVECNVCINLAALGMSPEEGEMSYIREVARGASLIESSEGELCKVKLKLDPDVAHVLKLTRAW